MDIRDLSNIVLQIFGKTLSFFQHVGILQAYSFSHSNVFYSSEADKYLETFISLLEEIKDVLNKLHDIQTHKKVLEVVVLQPEAPLYLNNVEIFTTEQMIVQTTELSNIMGPTVIEEYVVPPIVAETGGKNTSWASQREKEAIEEYVVPPIVSDTARQNTTWASQPDKEVIEEYDVPPIVADTAHENTSWAPQTDKGEAGIRDKESEQDLPPEPPPPPLPPPSPSPLSPSPPPAKVTSQYVCSFCNKVLSSKASYKAHMSSHSGRKFYCCEHCGKLFSTNMILAAHLTRQHNLNTESALSCQECGKLFVRKSALDVHVKCHLGLKPFACRHCSRAFTQKVTRDTHQLTHTRDYKFPCSVCNKRYPNKAKLNYHMKSHGEPQFTCTLCGKLFATRQYLNAHHRTHDLGVAETTHCRLDTISSQVIVPSKSYSCSQCKRSFLTQHTLNVHTQQRHNPLSARYRYLEKRKMAPRQKFTCEVCGKEFLLRGSLIHHTRQMHSTELTELQKRPFSCHLCHKRFTLRSKAAVHMLTHSEAEHRCEVCGRMFRRKDALKRHAALVHESTASLTCKVCQHVSVSPGTYKEHMKSHAVHYTCAQCNKAFRSKGALSFHTKQTHEGSFKYHCNLCGKQFVRKCHYQGHLLSHSTARPFTCEICNKGFKDKKVCVEHTKRVHAHAHARTSLHNSANQLSTDQLTPHNMAASEMNIDSLLAGDNATYGHTYDQFQACVQLQ